MTVYLVGAGPGDPGLLTVRAASLLARADVVVHDRLVDPETLTLCRVGAELIDVGKAPGARSTTQDEINELLCRRGAHELVVRLKGGDPYLFGRGAEEAEALAAAGVDYEVVPGVSSVLAVPALAGVALTRRGVTSTVVLATGHDPDAVDAASVDWRALGRSEATLVLVMAVATRGAIARRLIAEGRRPDTPVLVVERGGTPEQRSRRTTLEALGALEVTSPATIVVGATAAQHLVGLERRPLHGRRVVLARAARDLARFADPLRDAGARVDAVTAIETVRIETAAAELRAALASRPSWVVCTSAVAVDATLDAVGDARALAGVRCAAVGPATAAALSARGIVADLVATSGEVGGLLEGFPAPERAGERVVYPRAARVAGDLGGDLRRAGYEVVEVVAYETRPVALDAADRTRLARADAVVVFSPSAFDAVAPALGSGVLVALGSSTAAHLERARHRPVRAAAPTPDAVLDALVAHFEGPAERR